MRTTHRSVVDVCWFDGATATGTIARTAPRHGRGRAKENAFASEGGLAWRSTSAPSAITSTTRRLGDPDGGIEPGTSFDDLPDDWVCPECGVERDEFELYEE